MGMRHWVLCAALCCVAGSVFASDKAEPAPKKMDPKVIATIGDLSIKADRFWALEKKAVTYLTESAGGRAPDQAQLMRIRQQLLGNLVQEVMVIDYATKNNLKPSDEELNKRVDQVKETAKEQGITYEQLLDRHGKTEEQLRALIGAHLGVEEQCKGAVSDEEVKKFGAQNGDSLPLRRCSHILYMYKGSERSSADRTKEEAQKLAEEALAKLKGGADFAELAKETSDCPSKMQGGDLDFFPRKNAMAEPFAAATYGLAKVGDLTGVVETSFGYHVIKLTELKEADELVRDHLVGMKFQEVLNQMEIQRKKVMQVNEQALKDGPGGPKETVTEEKAEPEAKKEAAEEAPEEPKAPEAPAVE